MPATMAQKGHLFGELSSPLRPRETPPVDRWSLIMQLYGTLRGCDVVLPISGGFIDGRPVSPRTAGQSKEPGSTARVEYRALLKSQPEHPFGMRLWPLCSPVYTAALSPINVVV